MRFEDKFSALQAQIENNLQYYTEYAEDMMQAPVLEAMRYSLLGGGKRIRAVLAVEFCKAFGMPGELAMPAACALEMIHAYSLIHDDLPCMDDDDMRRGKPSNHKQFGEGLAVLAGDGLLTLAFEVVSSDETQRLLGADCALALVRTLSQAAGEYGMLGGQVIDVLSEGHSLTLPKHHDMVAMKTGALICAAVHCGCIAAGASTNQTEKALAFAKKIGLAFQITDDILDVTGDSTMLGKNIGSDEKAQKVTFVSLMGLGAAQKEAEALFKSAQQDLAELFPENTFLPALTELLAHRNA
ncbi:polyprenyl synthetase family protein [Oscillospiraceae bacterium LTW-04]|nr:polyprenyl synthetase family protein [Oscillospiraceae bacterium MB24-C1]